MRQYLTSVSQYAITLENVPHRLTIPAREVGGLGVRAAHALMIQAFPTAIESHLHLLTAQARHIQVSVSRRSSIRVNRHSILFNDCQDLMITSNIRFTSFAGDLSSPVEAAVSCVFNMVIVLSLPGPA